VCIAGGREKRGERFYADREINVCVSAQGRGPCVCVYRIIGDSNDDDDDDDRYSAKQWCAGKPSRGCRYAENIIRFEWRARAPTKQ